MRTWTLTALMLCLAGCSEPAPQVTQPRKTVDQAKLAEAKKRLGAFLDEANKGLALLGSHPNRDAIHNESNQLHDLINHAAEAYPTNEKVSALVEEGRNMLRYFDAGLKVADYQARRKDVNPETAQKFIDKTCDGNIPAFRQTIEALREKLGPPSEAERPPAAATP